MESPEKRLNAVDVNETLAEICKELKRIAESRGINPPQMFILSMVALGGIAAWMKLSPNNPEIFEMFREGYDHAFEEIESELTKDNNSEKHSVN